MSWKQVSMGSIMKSRADRFKPNDIAIKGLKRIDKIDFSGKIYLSEKPSNTDMILVKKGDLVISGINVEKGAMAVYQDDEDITATIHYSSYEYDETKIDLSFLRNFLKSTEFIDALKEQVPGGIKTEIKPKHILPLKVFIPTELKEQVQIVEKLESNNSIINKQSVELTHQLDLVKQLRQAFLKEAMQGKLTAKWRESRKLSGLNIEPAIKLLTKIEAEKEKLVKEGKLKKQKPLPAIKEDEIPFDIPESWEWCRLGEIASNIEYGTSEKADLNSNDIPVLRMNNIQDGKIDFEKLKYVKPSIFDLPKLYLKKGDLLFNRTNSYELVGKSGVYHGEDDRMTFASYLIRIQFLKSVSVDFINSYINSSFCRTTQLEPDIIQQNGQANFNGTKLSNIICPLPQLSEQQQIVTKLDELMQYCDKLEESIKTSQQQNEMLLQQVLREALEPSVI